MWVLHRSFSLICVKTKIFLYRCVKNSNIWYMINHSHALFSDCKHYFEGTLEQSTLNVLRKNEVRLFTHYHDTGWFLSLMFIALLTPWIPPRSPRVSPTGRNWRLPQDSPSGGHSSRELTWACGLTHSYPNILFLLNMRENLSKAQQTLLIAGK